MIQRFPVGLSGFVGSVDRSLVKKGVLVRVSYRGNTVSRRQVLVGAGAAAVALVGGALAGWRFLGPQSALSKRPVGPDEVNIGLTVNGEARDLRVEPRVTLLDALRERLGLTGAKKSCDRGECGACTVLVNGRRVTSCGMLAIMADGADVTTIEGLASHDQLHPLQEAFIRHDAFQCGFCTSGQIMSAVGMLEEAKPRSAAEIRERMSGNLCRCGAYSNIVSAIGDVVDGRVK